MAHLLLWQRIKRECGPHFRGLKLKRKQKFLLSLFFRVISFWCLYFDSCSVFIHGCHYYWKINFVSAKSLMHFYYALLIHSIQYTLYMCVCVGYYNKDTSAANVWLSTCSHATLMLYRVRFSQLGRQHHIFIFYEPKTYNWVAWQKFGFNEQSLDVATNDAKHW